MTAMNTTTRVKVVVRQDKRCLPPPPRNGGDKERLARLKQRLMQFDADRDGRINWKELREAIRRCGAWFASLKAWLALHLADKDGNGFIDDDEIEHLIDLLADKDLDFKTCKHRPVLV